MDPRAMRRLTVFDVLLIAAVVLSSVAVLIRSWRAATPDAVVQVQVSGRLVEVLPLDRNRTVDVPAAGGEVEITVQDRRVRISQSDCPKRICVRSGWISRPGQTIVCVPRKLLVQISGAKPAHDAETY